MQHLALIQAWLVVTLSEQWAPWSLGVSFDLAACVSTTVAGAAASAGPVTMICPIMDGCGVQV
jgi:hypothetical protein